MSEPNSNHEPSNPETPEFTPEELKRAERHQYILYGAMVLFLVLPFVLLFMTGKLGGE